jgi:hypothetical protein
MRWIVHDDRRLGCHAASQLQLDFGDVHGRHLHDAARGVDESPLITSWEPRSMGRQVTFQTDIGKGRIAPPFGRVIRIRCAAHDARVT